MPSKKSKTQKRLSLWKAAQNCSEAEIEKIAALLAEELSAGDRVLLEGVLGAGKSTFARALIRALGVDQPPEGSPTFAIAHEYQTPSFDVVHVDLYRLKSESEIEDAGVIEYFWGRNAVVVCEWLSLWPEFQESVLNASNAEVTGAKHFQVELAISEKEPETQRDIEISLMQLS